MEHKKYRVFIADDEEMIQRLIVALIPWDELNLELAGTAINGQEAIDYLMENQADILITDARMPECDGIQLIKWCNEHGRNMKYIVISGYRQFEYAHGALQYGADSYLLKPINQEELIAKLNAIIDKFENTRHIDAADQAIAQNELNRDRMRRHFINSYIYDGKEIPNKEIPSVDFINEEFQMHFDTGIYRSVFFKVYTPQNSDINLDRAMDLIQKEVEDGWKEYLIEYIGCTVNSGVVFFINYHVSDETKLKNYLEEMHETLTRKLDAFEGVRLTIGIGHREYSLAKIKECLETAAYAIMYRFYLPHVSVIDYDNYSYKQTAAGSIWTYERRQLMENYIRTGNDKGIQKLIFDLKLELHQDRDISPVSIVGVLRAAAETASDVLNSVLGGNTEKYNLLGKYIIDVENSENIDSAAAYLEQMIMQCIEIMNTEMKQQELQPIRVIREYIDNHYAENISLNDVADQVQLSKNYVSAIFRKETGVNFLDYLTSKRIDEASKLLRKTNLSISDIAEKVGYTDVKYFSKMCKKNLGMNPSEYRKLYS